MMRNLRLYNNYFIKGSKPKKKKKLSLFFTSRLSDLKSLNFSISVTACIQLFNNHLDFENFRLIKRELSQLC